MPNNKLPITPKPITAAKPAGPILLPQVASSLHPKVLAAKINELPHPRRSWTWALVSILAGAILGGAFYWWTHRDAATPTPAVLDSISIPTSGDLVPRLATLPTGSVSRAASSLSLDLANAGNPYPGNYTYAIRLMDIQNGGVVSAITLTPFTITEDGDLLDEEGAEVTSFPVDDISEFNRIAVVVNQAGDPTQPATILTGNLPSVGSSANLNHPLSFANVKGRTDIAYNAEKKQFELNLSAQGLPSLEGWGWRYQVWLAKLTGPYVEETKSAGILSAGGQGTANHTFESEIDLTQFDSLIITLEPLEDANPAISPIRVISADLN